MYCQSCFVYIEEQDINSSLSHKYGCCTSTVDVQQLSVSVDLFSLISQTDWSISRGSISNITTTMLAIDWLKGRGQIWYFKY